MAAFVLGNGVSRQAVDIDQLRKQGMVYGCNALYRSHDVDVLVATDQHIARAIQESGYSLRNKFFTRRPLPRLNAQTVPKEYFGFSSGPIAAALAGKDGHDPIYLLGFDLGPDKKGRFNNIYAGTQYYKPVNSEPTFVGNWVKQLQRIMIDHASQLFVRVAGCETADISDLHSVKNLQTMPMAEFLTSINICKEK